MNTLEQHDKNHGKHGGKHMLMCVLMVVLAGVLILVGASWGAIAVLLILCPLMMIGMMWMMRGENKGSGKH